jgi:hypothetical protein
MGADPQCPPTPSVHAPVGSEIRRRLPPTPHISMSAEGSPNPSHAALRAFVEGISLADAADLSSAFKRWRQLCGMMLQHANHRGTLALTALDLAATEPGNAFTRRAVLWTEMCCDVIFAMAPHELSAPTWLRRLASVPVAVLVPSVPSGSDPKASRRSMMFTAIRARAERSVQHPQYVAVRDKVAIAIVEDACRRLDFRLLPWVFSYELASVEAVIQRVLAADLRFASQSQADEFCARLVAALPPSFIARVTDPADEGASAVVCAVASADRARAGLYGALFERALWDAWCSVQPAVHV